MKYWQQVRRVAITNRAEIEADLDGLRTERSRAQQRLDELDRRIAAYELLVKLTEHADSESERNQPGLTLHEAMAQVLRSTGGSGMRAPDLASAINNSGLYRMRDGRPVEAQQIHARVGNYGHMFERRGTFIGLVEGAGASNVSP